MAGGKAPRRVPRAPCHPLPSRALTPRSPQEYYSELGNKLRAGVIVLPEDVFRVIAAALNYASHKDLPGITIRIDATEEETLGSYGLWRVTILEDGSSRPEHIRAGAHDQETHEEIVKSWYGEIRVSISHRKTGPAEYEFTARVRLTCGPDELWRALFFASRALFLAALREDPNSGVI